MKKNVLQLVGSFNQGGSERQAVQLIELLKTQTEHEIFVATLSKEGSLLDEVTKLGISEIPEFRLNSFYDLNFLKQIRRFRKYLRTNKIDVIQAHDFYSNVFGIIGGKLASTKVKIAAKRETSGMRTLLQKKIEARIFGVADKIVVNSAAVNNYLTSCNISPAKIAVIYNGLDIGRLEPKTTDRNSILLQLGLPQENDLTFISHVANLRHEVKNQDMVLRAAKEVIREFPSAHFVFAGEGERKNLLINLAKELGITENVHFIGACSRVPELLAASYACLLTSFAEGFSNSILEYMNAGKPVIATAVGGAPEVIENGVNGFLIGSDDDGALAERLIKLLSDSSLAEKLGYAGQKFVREKFSTTRQLHETLLLFNSV
ncbi:MAG: glycosyltransferase family 4 protein [Pyrinomonadaceae bacterium]